MRLAELDVALGPGALVGEIGVFAPDNRRTGTAVCESDVEIGAITDQRCCSSTTRTPRSASTCSGWPSSECFYLRLRRARS